MPKLVSGEEYEQEKPTLAYYPEKDGLGRFLGGRLEVAVMLGVWDSTGEEGYVGVDEVHQHVMNNYGEVRYTTVSRVMSRLSEKGILERSYGMIGVHRCLIFTPAHPTRDQYITYMVRSLLSSLLEQYRNQFIAWIVGNLEEFIDIKLDGSAPPLGRGHRSVGYRNLKRRSPR